MQTVGILQPVTIRNGWIFSPRYDLLYFYLPCLIGLTIVGYNFHYHFDRLVVLDKPTLVLLFAFAAFLDTGHILSTITQVYLDKDERQRYRTKLIVAPVFFLAVNLLIYFLFGMKFVLYFFGYFNYYHMIKQQYGWMAYSTRRSHFYNRVDFLFDKIFIYAVMLIPFAWAHFSTGGTDTRSAVLFFGNNQLIAGILKNSFIALAILFVIKQVAAAVLYRAVNLNKLFLLTSTAIAWGSIIFLRSPFLVFVTSIMHSVPYLALVYFYGEKRSRSRQQKSLLFTGSFSFILFPVIVFVCGFFYTHLLRSLAEVNTKKAFGYWFPVLSIALSVAFFMHYYLDGIIWKRRNFKPEEM